MSVESAVKEINSAGFEVTLTPLVKINRRYTVEEAAKELGKAKSTVDHLISSKNPALTSTKIKGSRYIYQSDIDKYNEKHSHKTKTKADFETDAETYCNNER